LCGDYLIKKTPSQENGPSANTVHHHLYQLSQLRCHNTAKDVCQSDYFKDTGGCCKYLERETKSMFC